MNGGNISSPIFISAVIELLYDFCVEMARMTEGLLSESGFRCAGVKKASSSPYSVEVMHLHNV